MNLIKMNRHKLKLFFRVLFDWKIFFGYQVSYREPNGEFISYRNVTNNRWFYIYSKWKSLQCILREPPIPTYIKFGATGSQFMEVGYAMDKLYFYEPSDKEKFDRCDLDYLLRYKWHENQGNLAIISDKDREIIKFKKIIKNLKVQHNTRDDLI